MDIQGALFTNQNATGNGNAVSLLSGGQYIFDVAGTFGGTTVKLQRLASDKATWIDVGSDASFTAAGHVLVTLSAGQYRAVSTGGAPAGIYSSLRSAF
ncbi:hypothetical protein ACP46_gp13 [Rhizobium phage RHEph06]|uniref:Uncharacterized protein n=4 Tax=Kleczkowskavirus RHEph4 TaxID=1921526 RepID=A0A7S5QWV4_9CAUD|nr:hypothetical protein ACP46_gp13 [Rhizobium phage RHEph06]YP_009598454.1 hypothetical protein FDH25_gp12 [Rhizobium phage RHEph04]AGC35774.1 hypothetical protein RHEph05_gp007 [Rhizobium phage RHEph05]QIG67637.1 hypothetical protein EVB51_020 [Rhizobium phage RHph_Y17]QIG68956.1 hypothetical protein EVB73_020 [Rhizobium phage RHph_Y3_43]QIG69505.1 hypothetical protein EVB80_022 [Rhizobium phage RHph_I36]QIG75379.1 hypothetical protein EVC17_022 [Rhizobium phage RHph_Y1_1]QIG75929.1 hypothe